MQKSHKAQKDDCCKDEHKLIKNVNDQKLTEAAFNLAHASSIALPISFIELHAVKIASITEENPVSNAPPRSQVAIYLRDCVFRI